LRALGQLGDAQRISDAVLAANPRDFDALHLSGVLKHQQGRMADALRLVAAALREQPDRRTRWPITAYSVRLIASGRPYLGLGAVVRPVAP
jgi:Tetratricopeptide repeat